MEALEYNDSYTYSLIYVDEDEIPELVADSGFEAGGCQILTWHEGKTDVLQTSRLYFTYLEKGNLLCNSSGNMGFYYDNVYTIEDGLWSFVGGGTYGDSEGGPQFDENGDFVYEYYWLEEPVEPDFVFRDLQEYTAAQADLSQCLRGLDYRFGEIQFNRLERPRSLMDVFRSLPYRRTGVDVKV